jgi:hypothetical protein
LWGEPIEIAADLDQAGLEDARRLIEERMVNMVEEADRRVGRRVPLFPADAPVPSPGAGNAAGTSSLSSSEKLYRSASVR